MENNIPELADYLLVLSLGCSQWVPMGPPENKNKKNPKKTRKKSQNVLLVIGVPFRLFNNLYIIALFDDSEMEWKIAPGSFF